MKFESTLSFFFFFKTVNAYNLCAFFMVIVWKFIFFFFKYMTSGKNISNQSPCNSAQSDRLHDTFSSIHKKWGQHLKCHTLNFFQNGKPMESLRVNLVIFNI